MIRTILFFTYVWGSMIVTLPLCIIFFIMHVLGLKKIISFLLWPLVHIWTKILFFFGGMKLTVIGRENIPKKGNLCFISNHQGDMDVMIFLATLPHGAGFIAKKETLFFPIVNLWIVIFGSVFIDRKNLKKAHASIEKGIIKLKKGNSLIIFPEGTRSRNYAMNEFHKGSFKLPIRSLATIIPVTINNSFKTWEEKHLIQKTHASIQFHAPVETSNLNTEERRNLSQQIFAIISEPLKPFQEKNNQ